MMFHRLIVAWLLRRRWRPDPCGPPRHDDDGTLRCPRCGAAYVPTDRGWIHGVAGTYSVWYHAPGVGEPQGMWHRRGDGPASWATSTAARLRGTFDKVQVRGA